MGFESGVLLAGSGLPGALRLLCSLVLGLGLPWMAFRALNRRLRFWLGLHPDGLEVGPAKYGWRVPYQEVALVQESYFEEPGEDRYLAVFAGAKEASIILSHDDVRTGALAIVARCPSAVRVDDRGGEHLPEALASAGDPASEPARRAVHNLAVLNARYKQATIRMAAVAVVCLAGLIFAGAAYLGLVRLSPDARLGFLIPSTFFGAVFGFFGWKQFGQWQAWDQLCKRYSGAATTAAPPSAEGARRDG
jgi:hypothetical protein